MVTNLLQHLLFAFILRVGGGSRGVQYNNIKKGKKCKAGKFGRRNRNNKASTKCDTINVILPRNQITIIIIKTTTKIITSSKWHNIICGNIISIMIMEEKKVTIQSKEKKKKLNWECGSASR